MNDLDQKREEILKELKRSITFYLDGYASYIREGAPCGLDEEQVLNLTAMEVDHILKDYGAIVEQQTRDAVIEEVRDILRMAWSDEAGDHLETRVVETWLDSFKSKPTPEEKL